MRVSVSMFQFKRLCKIFVQVLTESKVPVALLDLPIYSTWVEFFLNTLVFLADNILVFSVPSQSCCQRWGGDDMTQTALLQIRVMLLSLKLTG